MLKYAWHYDQRYWGTREHGKSKLDDNYKISRARFRLASGWLVVRLNCSPEKFQSVPENSAKVRDTLWMLLVGNRNHQMGPAAVQPVMLQWIKTVSPSLSWKCLRCEPWHGQTAGREVPCQPQRQTWRILLYFFVSAPFTKSKPNVPTSMCASQAKL